MLVSLLCHASWSQLLPLCHATCHTCPWCHSCDTSDVNNWVTRQFLCHCSTRTKPWDSSLCLLPIQISAIYFYLLDKIENEICSECTLRPGFSPHWMKYFPIQASFLTVWLLQEVPKKEVKIRIMLRTMCSLEAQFSMDMIWTKLGIGSGPQQICRICWITTL